MDFKTYQQQSRSTAMYPGNGSNFVYPALGLAGETGEVVEKVKKLIRNDSATTVDQVSEEKKMEVENEMGDVLWYLAQLATELHIDLESVAVHNLEKIASRKERGVLHSEGDNR